MLMDRSDDHALFTTPEMRRLQMMPAVIQRDIKS
jgi:hypothetical protein